MKRSARRQSQVNGVRINEGRAMAELVLKVGALKFVAAMTGRSVKNMGLTVNDQVTVAVKATEVMIGKEAVEAVDLPGRCSYDGAGREPLVVVGARA